MRAAIAFDNYDDLIYNVQEMKKSVFLKLSAVATVCAATLILMFSSGCFLFKDSKLDAPAVERTGSIFSWGEVEGANKYLVRTGSKSQYIEEREIRVANIDKGGQLGITAVNMAGEEIKAKSEEVVLEFTEIRGTNYAEYDISEGKDIKIPNTVDKAVIVGDGERHDSGVTVAMRTTPLIIELHDAQFYGLHLEEGTVVRKEACITLRSLGDKGNAVYGSRGAEGSEGVFAGGILQADGKSAAKLGYVIFEGDADIEFYGGSGGDGGRGGKPGALNSKGGDGGTGGNGGTGLIVEQAIVCLSGELNCSGGSGGSGGAGGAGKWFIGIGYDDGDEGRPGSSGTDLVGGKTIKDLLTFNLNGEIKDGVSYGLDAPVVERIGNIFSWGEVEGANKYLIRTGSKSQYIEEREIRVANIDEGGQLSITAVNVENGEIKAKSEEVLLEFTEISGVKYAEYDLTDGNDIKIPNTVDKAVIVGDGELYESVITVAVRNKPLIIELHDAQFRGLYLEENSTVNKEACITIRSLGENGNAVYGLNGADGENGVHGDVYGDNYTPQGGKGGTGNDGKPAAKLGYVVFEGDTDIAFNGGNGGKGGNGGNSVSTSIVNKVKGGNGGDGGNGGAGLIAERAFICLHGELNYSGGDGGAGGNGGKSDSFMYEGAKGVSGSSGEGFVGEKRDGYILTFTLNGKIEGDASAPDGGAVISGTYGFYSMSDGKETYYVGDYTPSGELLTADVAKLTFYADGSCALSFNGEIHYGTWEAGGNLLALDIDGSTMAARFNGNDLELKTDEYTLVLRK